MRRALVAALVLCPVLLLPQVASARPKVASDVPCKVPATFGRMFTRLPAAHWPDAELTALSDEVMADQEADVTPEGQVNDEENGDIDAGYTYTGQLIDHDLTLDNRPNDLTTPVDPRTLPNARTPAFDLDSVYGGGPTGSPQLYAADRMHLLLGAPLTGTPSDPGSVDMPRDPASGQALSGDPRDDENRIVAGLHTIMLRFHNEWVRPREGAAPAVVGVADLRRGPAAGPLALPVGGLDRLPADHRRQTGAVRGLPEGRPHPPAVVLPALRAGDAGGVQRGCLPLRPLDGAADLPPERRDARAASRLRIASPDANDLGGFRPSPPGLSVNWRFFFNMEQPRRVGFPQASYKIDNSLVFPLSLLPTGAAGSGPTSLAVRNLLRGQQVGLPSGQAVARAMGIRPLRPDQILVGKATDDEADAEPISAIAPDLATSTPLWTYVLAETAATAYPVRGGRITGPQVAPFRLGPVGGRIVAEVFAGLMQADRGSVVNTPGFRPNAAIAPGGRFGFKDLIAATTSNALAKAPGTTTPTGGSGGGGGRGATSPRQPHRQPPHRSDA